jgi:hypothetical protein
MSTYIKELKFITAVFDEKTEAVIEKEVIKTANFKELSRLDKTQHKLHFKLISLFEGLEKSMDEQDSIGISSDGLYDITVKAVKILLVTDSEFTENDKNDFLNDSISLLQFGMWLFKEKFTPFFSAFNMT